jgi:hypothetical protein
VTRCAGENGGEYGLRRVLTENGFWERGVLERGGRDS